ncbi:coiled-coil domain-containing protein 124-like isoform X1 [Lineus longissimus]|uniref:coiled-coil domain-containing protein 124-like isoform X1 n=1 Tax=Lineus longissimus TaxID=88925 RepID=UPI002B4EC5EE
MPKKFVGENSKAAVARARKNAKAEEEKERKQKEEDDAYWKDDDKHVMRKQNRKDDREKKKQEQQEKKLELKKLHDEEMESIKTKQAAPTKMTRAQIEAERERQAAFAAASKKEDVPLNEQPLEENINRLETDGTEARSVVEAIQVLSVKDNTSEVDLHPEKRVKAAYAAFEERNLPQLKAENPNLRLSQLKQMIRKDWMKSPENPLNQRLQEFNHKR